MYKVINNQSCATLNIMNLPLTLIYSIKRSNVTAVQFQCGHFNILKLIRSLKLFPFSVVLSQNLITRNISTLDIICVDETRVGIIRPGQPYKPNAHTAVPYITMFKLGIWCSTIQTRAKFDTKLKKLLQFHSFSVDSLV